MCDVFVSRVRPPAAGAIDEAMFISAFEDVPKVTLYSHKDLEDNMVKIRETVSQPSNPWDKRIEAVSGRRRDPWPGVIQAHGVQSPDTRHAVCGEW